MELHFQSEDGRFGLLVEAVQVKELVAYCVRAGRSETGGILIGSYTAAHDCARVHEVTGPPVDSKGGRTWFHRGVRGLQRRLDALWRIRQGFYLGEWHLHPFAAPFPSGYDRRQMIEIAQSRNYHCPEPVLLIIGGDPRSNWTARAFVYSVREGEVEMIRSNPPISQ